MVPGEIQLEGYQAKSSLQLLKFFIEKTQIFHLPFYAFLFCSYNPKYANYLAVDSLQLKLVTAALLQPLRYSNFDAVTPLQLNWARIKAT